MFVNLGASGAQKPILEHLMNLGTQNDAFGAALRPTCPSRLHQVRRILELLPWTRFCVRVLLMCALARFDVHTHVRFDVRFDVQLMCGSMCGLMRGLCAV